MQIAPYRASLGTRFAPRLLQISCRTVSNYSPGQTYAGLHATSQTGPTGKSIQELAVKVEKTYNVLRCRSSDAGSNGTIANQAMPGTFV